MITTTTSENASRVQEVLTLLNTRPSASSEKASSFINKTDIWLWGVTVTSLVGAIALLTYASMRARGGPFIGAMG